MLPRSSTVRSNFGLVMTVSFISRGPLCRDAAFRVMIPPAGGGGPWGGKSDDGPGDGLGGVGNARWVGVRRAGAHAPSQRAASDQPGRSGGRTAEPETGSG